MLREETAEDGSVLGSRLLLDGLGEGEVVVFGPLVL
jgi:hypothetical protein